MATTPHVPARGARRRTVLALILVALAAGVVTPLRSTGARELLDGRAPRTKASTRPSVTAAFPLESYAPDTTARLVISSPARSVTLQVFRAGAEYEKIAAHDEMRGIPVTRRSRLQDVTDRRVVPVRIGAWRSGLYFARLTAAGGRVGYAPFVLRPRRLGTYRVAVVLPTFTWQAYNHRDDDGDGDEDTWYASQDEQRVQLGRPYLNRGVPPYYRVYDQPFLRWLFHTARGADYFADSDLDAVASGRRLAEAYDLIIFPGHHEYVTEREYDAVTEFRNLGGNLMFLSANNFFWRVDKRGNGIFRIRQWRDLGRPEAGLIGVQYAGNDGGGARGPWIVRAAESAPWLFSGTGLENGDELSSGGIEIDAVASSSPPGVKVLAEIPNLLGPGKTAQMTYYETRGGASVFASGAFTLAGSVWQRPVARLLENLWARLSADGNRERVQRGAP